MSKKIRAIGVIREHNIRMVLPGSNKCLYTINKGSQTALVTRLSVSLCLGARRGTRPPLVLAFGGSV